MLRWKTTSAICAIMITACPLTSFGQQIVKPAPPEISILQPLGPIKIPGQVRKTAYQPLVPLVSPQQAVAANPTLRPPTGIPEIQEIQRKPELRTAALNPLPQTPPIQLKNNPLTTQRAISSTYRPPQDGLQAVERAASPKIIIRTPFVQPHNPNNYLFVVENVGSVDATAASVDLYVPRGVVITNVVPRAATNTAQRAHVRLVDLKAGAKSIIEVEVSPTTEVVEFQTRMSLESVHKFTTAADPKYVKRSKPSDSYVQLQKPITSFVVAPTPPVTPVTTAAPVATTTPVAPTTPVFTTAKTSVAAPLTPLEIASPSLPFETPQTQAETANSSVDYSPRSGKAQPPNLANAIANNANAVQAKLVSATQVAAQATVDAKLSATVDGPVTLDANQLANFSITVTNPNQSAASGIVVQLAVPNGLKVTVLDRDAWFDAENRTLSWEIPYLKSGAQETIQYKAIGQAIGQQNQKVTIGMQDVYQGKAQLVTLVSN